MEGRATLTLTDSQAQLHDLLFKDNRAKLTNHVLTVEHDKALNLYVNLTSSVFESSQHLLEYQNLINGSYLYILQTPAATESLRKIKVDAKQNKFRMGDGKFGGAIYTGKIKNFTF
jgi:hypothetical protein